ncbi:MAG: HXXEE domain-containing protein [Hyphomonadaceae bacterium]|nr:HXXEE domain-containing protein [Hyphomonadaceae bacterium]
MTDEQSPSPDAGPAPYSSHGRAWAAAMAAFLIHSVEEVALNLPAWVGAHPVLPWLGWMAPAGMFATVVGVLTAVVGGLAIYAMATAPRWSRRVLIVFAAVMLGNAASHIVLSAMTSSLMPGVATAGLVVVPVFAGVLWAVLRRAQPRAG